MRSCSDFGAADYSKSWEVAVLFENAKCERVTGEMSTITEVSRVSVTLHSSVRSLFNRWPSLSCYATTDIWDIGVLVLVCVGTVLVPNIVCRYDYSTRLS